MTCFAEIQRAQMDVFSTIPFLQVVETRADTALRAQWLVEHAGTLGER
jgi:hypothetical protein